jgi:hypothetical protein
MALTTNLNYLQPTGFRVIIDRENYPNLEFFAQTISHPDVSLPPPPMPTRRFENVVFPGDTISYSELSITFIVDEDLAAYKELYNWMESLTDENFVGQGPRSRRIAPEIPSQADISVSILSSHNNQNNRILYKGCTPTSIGALEFTTTSQTVEFITFDVTFGFTGFDFKG